MTIEHLGSWASIIGIVISLISGLIALATYLKVENLKRNFLLMSRGKEFANKFEKTYNELSILLEDFSGNGNFYKIRDLFKGIDGSLQIVKDFTPSSSVSILNDIKVIRKSIKKSQEEGKNLYFDDYKKMHESLNNIKTTLPELINNQV